MADNIKVVIKVRPLIKREIDDSLQKQWTVSDNTIFPTGQQFGREGMGEFTFDYVFDDESLTQDVYEKVARPIVEAAVGGMNGTIFAYGQTSSGKTYTMMGDACSPGVIPLAVSNIFHAIESKVDRDFLLRVSYIEIYNEKIRDLLDVTKTDLKIHEDHTGQVTVKCHEEVTSKSSQVLEVMKRGDKNRSTGETQMNERSSRSHTIFIIIIESRRHVMPGEEEEDSVNVSQLNLVDLAGSERPAQTGATHQRLREGGHINKSLHMLGNVIRQLSDAQGDTSRFISFRDSKLTRILQTSLGGNAKTGIICAVTPAVLDETYSTLKFAMCAKAIQNKPKINAVVSDATQIKTLTREMKYLQEELEKKNHLEVDNKRLQEQLALLRDKILMGGTEEVSVQRAAALRRRTWCAPQRAGLPAIQEHAFHGINFNNVQRLSNVTERNDDSFVTSRDSASSNREMVHEEIVILDDSGEEDTLANSRNTCFDPNCTEISHTALCKWKYRASKAEKELIQLEELTSLEKTCGPVEMELLQNICILRLEKKSADEKCEVFSQQTKSYTELQTQFENLTKDYEESRCKLTELTDLTQSIPAYKSEIQQLKVLLESNNLEMDAIKLDLQSKVTLIETLESRILEKGDNSDLQIQVENLTKDYEESCRKLTELTDLTQSIPAYESEIQQLKVLLSSNNLEMDAIKLELQSKITLIETMEARAHEEGNIFSQQTKLYSELQTQFENLTKDYEESTCKLTELTDLTQSIPAYESENQQFKVLLNSNNLEMDAIKLELQSKITLIETMQSRILEKGDNSELQMQIENLTKDYEESRCKLTELIDLTQSIPAYKSEIEQLKVLLNSNNLEMDSIKLELQAKISLIESMEASNNSELQIQIENLTKDLEASCSKLAVLTDLTQSIPTYESEILQLKALLNSNNLEMDAIRLELQSKITLIETMEARAREEGDVLSQQTKLNSELQTQFERLTKDFEDSRSKLAELTDLTQTIPTYESEILQLKALLNSNNLEMDAIRLELQSKITLIEIMEARAREEEDILSQQTKLNSELQTQFERLTKDFEDSRSKLAELTDLTQTIPTYESEILQLKALLNSNNLEMDAIRLELQSKITLIEIMEARAREEEDILSQQTKLNSELQTQFERLTKDFEDSRSKLAELTDLTQTIPTNESEILQLKALLNSNNLEMDAIRLELQSKITLIEIMEARAREEGDILSQQTKLNSELQTQFERLTKDFEDSRSKLAELTDLTQTIPTYESEILQLKALLNSNNLEMDAIRLELQAKITLIETMEACVPEKGDNSELQIQIENLTKDLEESRSKLAELTDLTQSIPTYESEILQLKALLNSNNLEMEAIKLELQAKITLIETMEACVPENGDISELQIQIENLTKDLEESHSKLAELTDFTQSIPTYESEILQLKALLNSNNLEMDAIKLELQSKITLIETTEACVPELQIQIENLTKDLEESRSKLAELRDLTQSIPTYESEILQLKTLLNSNNLEMDAIKLELQSKITLIETMEACVPEKGENSELQIQIENLTKDLEESRSKLAELRDLTQSIPTYESEILQLKALLSSNNLEMDAIKLELQSKITLIETMEARAREEADILSQQTKLNSELQTQFESLTKDIEESRSKLAELTDFTQSISAYESEILQLKEQVARINEEKHENLLNVEGQTETDKILIAQLETTITSMNQQITCYQQQLSEEKLNFQQKESDLKSMCENNIINSDEILALRESISILENERIELMNDCNTKSSQIAKLKQDLLDTVIQFSSISEIKEELPKNLDKIANEKTSIFPELMPILAKRKELEIALQESLVSNNLLKEKVLRLENTNDELKRLLYDIFVTISELDKIHHEKYTDVEITFSGSIIDDYVDVMKQSIHNILSLKSVLQTKLSLLECETFSTVIVGENTPDSESILSVQTACEFVDISQVQDEGKLVSALDESKCVVDQFTCNHGLQDLEILISTLESHISDVYSRLEVQQQTVLTDVDKNIPINNNLEAKLTKIINMHNSLLQHIEDLILSKIDDNEKLMEENLLLKSEIQQSMVEVKELVKEAEELQKKVLNQRSENEVSNAEYSLLNSRLTSVQHYHTNLHSFCNSTTSYLQLELTELMSLLQDPNQTERENTFYTDDFITPKKSCILESQTEDVSEKTPVSLMSNFTVDKFQCTDAASGVASLIGVPEESDENLKTTCENLRCDLDSKCSEIRRLTDQLTDYESLKERYCQLQNELESLSNELMDSLQEVDETKSKYQSLEKELSIVNECRKVSEEEIRLSEEQLKNISDKNASLQQSLQRLTEVIEVEKKTFDTELREKEKHLEDNIVKHNEQLQIKLNMIIDFENKLSQLTETVAEREVLIDNISHKYDDEKKKSSLQITCLEEQINTLRTENKKDKEAMFSLISNTEQLSCLLKEKDQEIIEKEKEISQLKTLSRSSTGCTDAASDVAQFNSVSEESDESLKAACEILRCDLDSKCSEIKRLTDQLIDYESLKERYHQLQNEHESLSNELMDSLQEVDQTKSKCQSLDNELSMLNECRKVSEEEIRLSEEQLKNMRDKNASLQQSLQRLTEVIEAEKKTFETALREKEKNLEDNIVKHNEQLQTKLNMIIDFENKLSQLTETVAEREVRIDDISHKYEDEKKKSSLQITCLEEQINTLLTEKKTFETALRDKEKHLEDNIAEHNEQLQTKLNMIIDFENKLSQLTETVAEREVLIDNISHKYEDEKKKSSLQITCLEEQINTLRTENKKDKEAMFSLISNTEQLSCLLKEKDQEIIEKEKEISQLKMLSRSSTGLECELQKSHKELKNQKDFIQELQSKLTSMEERTTKDAEKIRLESENSRLLSANTILQGRVADIQSELNALLKSSPKIRHDVQLKRQSLHDQQRSLVICNASIKQEDNDVSMEDCEMATESSNLKRNVEQLEWQLKAAQDRYEQLEQVLIGSQQSLKHKAEEYARVVAAYQTLEVQMQEMRQQLVTLSSKNKQDASTNTNQKEDQESLMSLFVDRMTHDLLKDKHQVLQRANEDLRMRNKEQASELRRLLHSHQDNALHSRLPKDSSKDPEKLMGEIKGLEQELKTWKEKLEECEVKYKEQEDWKAKYKEQEDWEAKYKEQEDWEAKYKEMDVEYDVCVDELRETIITYNKVFSEKLLIEAELKHVKGKLEEMQEGSPSWEVRRKRQSLYDANRGTIPTTVEASTNTVPEDHESLMSLFVDRITHDLLKEKHQVLQRVNEDLRMRNKEQASELRRLLHSHQDNTVHSRLPKDSSKDSEKLKGEIKGLEQELKTWKEKLEECEAKYKEQEDWEAKYKEMDAEYDTCADELRQTIITYNKVFSEKLLVEAELKHVKGKLEEMQEGSPSWEVRRKRRSLYDANRGTIPTTVEASTNTVPDDFNRSSRLQICEKCEPTRKNLQELQNKNMELESRLSLRPATIASSLSPHLVGSAIVQNHQLHEYMKENQILTAKAEKYKTFYLKYRNQIKKNDEK